MQHSAAAASGTHEIVCSRDALRSVIRLSNTKKIARYVHHGKRFESISYYLSTSGMNPN